MKQITRRKLTMRTGAEGPTQWTATAAVATSTVTIREMAQEIETLRQQLAEKEAEIAKLTKKLGDTLARIKSGDSVETTIAVLTERAEKAEARVKHLEADCADIHKGWLKALARIKELEKGVDTSPAGPCKHNWKCVAPEGGQYRWYCQNKGCNASLPYLSPVDTPETICEGEPPK